MNLMLSSLEKNAFLLKIRTFLNDLKLLNGSVSAIQLHDILAALSYRMQNHNILVAFFIVFKFFCSQWMLLQVPVHRGIKRYASIRTKPTNESRPESGLRADVLIWNVKATSGAPGIYVQGKQSSYIKGKRNRSSYGKKTRRNHCEIFQAKPEHFQNKTSENFKCDKQCA